MLWVVPALFGGTLVLASWLVRGHRESSTVAGHLWVIWALANAAWLANMLWLLPVFDLALGVALLNLWSTAQTRWVALLVHAVAIRLILHSLNALTGHLFFIAYVHALNATFVWMLVVVASTGGHNGSVTDRFRDLRRRLFLSRRPTAAGKEVAHGR